ncbi:MAG: hypothetical protein DWQ01_12990 [Planctomycetota bacterium]|nr:MAG: hypothetical protein DWQ01_12990 [Planctomycetota bacterium]
MRPLDRGFLTYPATMSSDDQTAPPLPSNFRLRVGDSEIVATWDDESFADDRVLAFSVNGGQPVAELLSSKMEAGASTEIPSFGVVTGRYVEADAVRGMTSGAGLSLDLDGAHFRGCALHPDCTTPKLGILGKAVWWICAIAAFSIGRVLLSYF